MGTLTKHLSLKRVGVIETVLHYFPLEIQSSAAILESTKSGKKLSQIYFAEPKSHVAPPVSLPMRRVRLKRHSLGLLQAVGVYSEREKEREKYVILRVDVHRKIE